MKNLIFREMFNAPCEAEPFLQTRVSERLPVLAARRTASLLQDATLTSLFHSYRVELFDKPVDLYIARSAQVSCALLCASAGCSLLAAEAHIIRKQWPFAKIILLGLAPRDFEDHLYDDTVAANCNVATLATAFSNRSVYLSDRRVGLHTGKAELPLVPVESDPTKAKPSDLLQPPGGGPRDLPADEKQEMCRALVS